MRKANIVNQEAILELIMVLIKDRKLGTSLPLANLVALVPLVKHLTSELNAQKWARPNLTGQGGAYLPRPNHP